MKKLFISFIAMLSVVFFFISGKGYANEVVDNTVTEQQNLEGQVLSHYLKVEEKEGHYTLHFYNKKELKEVLRPSEYSNLLPYMKEYLEVKIPNPFDFVKKHIN